MFLANNKKAAILLDGYIEIHNQICNKSDCPLKQNSSKVTRMTKTLMETIGENLNERYILVLQLVHKTYINGIKRLYFRNFFKKNYLDFRMIHIFESISLFFY